MNDVAKLMAALIVLGIGVGCDETALVRVRISAMAAPVGARATWDISASAPGSTNGRFVEVRSREATEDGIPPVTAEVECAVESGEHVISVRLVSLSGAALPFEDDFDVKLVDCGASDLVEIDVTAMRELDDDGFFDHGADGFDVAFAAGELTCSATLACDADSDRVALEVACVAPNETLVQLDLTNTSVICREASDAEIYDTDVWGPGGNARLDLVHGVSREVHVERGDLGGARCAVQYAFELDREALAHQRCWLAGFAIPSTGGEASRSRPRIQPVIELSAALLEPDGTLCADNGSRTGEAPMTLGYRLLPLGLEDRLGDKVSVTVDVLYLPGVPVPPITDDRVVCDP